MEWVETTAKTIDSAREVALDQLGITVDEAEIEILEEPKAGLFGRTRGEARLRARVKPTPVRAKQERRRRSGGKSAGGKSGAGKNGGGTSSRSGGSDDTAQSDADGGSSTTSDERSRTSDQDRNPKKTGSSRTNQSRKQDQKMSTTNGPNDVEREDREPVSPEEVGDAAVAFMDGLTSAFGVTETATLTIDGTELDVVVHGEELGLLVGSGGRTLNAIQDLARVAAQRRLGDHETRLRIDVAGYRERRQAALTKFAAAVAEEVRSSGERRSMEPMNSADRKVVHDALNEEEGVESQSEGEDPNRRIVVVPTD